MASNKTFSSIEFAFRYIRKCKVATNPFSNFIHVNIYVCLGNLSFSFINLIVQEVVYVTINYTIWHLVRDQPIRIAKDRLFQNFYDELRPYSMIISGKYNHFSWNFVICLIVNKFWFIHSSARLVAYSWSPCHLVHPYDVCHCFVWKKRLV